MIKKIVVYTYGKTNQANTIKAAANFALQHDAELTGLFVRPDIINYSAIYGEYPFELSQTYYNLQNEYAEAAEKSFSEIVDKVGCRAEWHVIDEFEQRPKPALYADFLFVSQPIKDNNVTFDYSTFVDHLIVETGLPIVIIPQDWTKEKLSVHPILAWKEGREAVSAVRLTLPLMRDSEEVDIVTALKPTDNDIELIKGIEISGYLAAHDINCKFFTTAIKDADKNETSALLRHANENGCDLIIAGGYGHSRLREIVLGGVTRGLIQQTNLPVILVH